MTQLQASWWLDWQLNNSWQTYLYLESRLFWSCVLQGCLIIEMKMVCKLVPACKHWWTQDYQYKSLRCNKRMQCGGVVVTKDGFSHKLVWNFEASDDLSGYWRSLRRSHCSGRSWKHGLGSGTWLEMFTNYCAPGRVLLFLCIDQSMAWHSGSQQTRIENSRNLPAAQASKEKSVSITEYW